MSYKYYQPNKKDLKDKYGDCVIRALTKLMEKDWIQVFDELIPYAREIQCMPNQKTCFKKYLEDNGYVYHGISNKKGSKRPTVSSFSRSHKKVKFFLNVANHVVASVDGTYYDKWDSGEKSLYGYWELKE